MFDKFFLTNDNIVSFGEGVNEPGNIDLANQWESAIRQAWMPVTPQSSTGSGAGQLRGNGSVVL